MAEALLPVSLPAALAVHDECPPEALTDATLGRLLGALASRPGPVPKYRYPSSGTLYPVQAYVALRQALRDIAAGSYYHDPEGHALVALSDHTPAAPDGSEPPALLLLVAQHAAIEPIYGAQAPAFCLLEAGYMSAALQASAGGLRLRDTGDPARLPYLVEACALDTSHVPLVCWAIGESP